MKDDISRLYVMKLTCLVQNNLTNLGVDQKRILTLNAYVAPKERFIEEPVETRVSFRWL